MWKCPTSRCGVASASVQWHARGPRTMSNLAEKHCVPCRGGTSPLSGAELIPYAEQLPDWKIIDPAQDSFLVPGFRRRASVLLIRTAALQLFPLLLREHQPQLQAQLRQRAR